jgi:hypothetical protein
MKINQSTWYSGSPIAFSLTGMKAAKQILLVDLDIATPETVSVQKIEVPQHRRILKLEGTLSEIKKHIADLKCTLSFPPLLHVVIDRANSINFHRSDLNSNLSEALKLHPENLRPILSTVEVLDSKSTEEHSSTIQPSKTDPLPVFEHLCLVEGKTGEERSQLLHAFNTIAQHSNADFNDFVAQIQDPNHETS